MQINKKNIITCILLLVAAAVYAQEVAVSAHGAEGLLIKKDYLMRDLIQTQDSRYYGLAVSWKAKGDSISVDDRMWGRPVIEGGLLLGDFHSIRLHARNHEPVKDVGYVSGLGCMITPYAAFRRSLLRTSVVDAGCKFENGIGIITRPYDIADNVENELVGSRVTAFVGLGMYASLRVSRHVSLGVDATFRHYSSGKLNQPNIGINTVDVGVKATYTLQPDTMRRTPYEHGFNAGFRKRLYADISVGWSPQTLLSDWKYEWLQVPSERSSSFDLYNAWTADVGMMWRYSRKYASGIGMDYAYFPFMDAVEKSEDRYYGHSLGYDFSSHVLGVSLRHEAFYKNMAMHLSFGWYLHRRLGDVADLNQTPYYETIGLRWYTPFTNRRVYLGYNINACAFKANYFQFMVGVTVL